MNLSTYFERLVETVDLIARHAYYPGKQEAVDRCLEDIEDLARAGRITGEQEEILREILQVDCTPMALQPALAS